MSTSEPMDSANEEPAKVVGAEDDSSDEEKETETPKEEGEPRRAVVSMVQSKPGALPLDWTRVQPTPGGEEAPHPVRLVQDVTEIDPQDTELVLVGTAGQKVTKMGPNLSDLLNPQLNQLILRSHLIRTMEGLAGLQELELLELYDNMIEALGALNEGPNGAPGRTLRVLDMSYNVIRDMLPVRHCPNLTELYLANNKLKTMAGLQGLEHLRKLDLGANRIRVMDADQLSGLVNLEELWLGKNKIEVMQGLDKLPKLKRLDVQSNRLTKISNLESLVGTLEELYLAHNGIDNDGAAAGLASLTFTSLTTLDLSRNRLTSTEPLCHLLTLEDLWLSSNQISTYEAVAPLAALGESLDEIYLEYNPIASDFEYRKKLKEMIPSLTKIDANMITGTESAAAAAQASLTRTSGGGSTEEELRRLQEQAVARAHAESNG